MCYPDCEPKEAPLILRPVDYLLPVDYLPSHCFTAQLSQGRLVR